MIRNSDFQTFQWIFGMDDYNITDLEDLSPKEYQGQIALLGSFDPQGQTIIRDPYGDNHDNGFIKCYNQCTRACSAFLEKVEGRKY
ncbi:unnamed protein product [Allacma fusca]|uniref:protein-tyrosine-phosphatase n=1 Tax=Allacma fusca TaxID=39272 RepID=A0A8J2PEU4_9HEXA|nr:unnamed protein product [Allacma fusca]